MLGILKNEMCLLFLSFFCGKHQCLSFHLFSMLVLLSQVMPLKWGVLKISVPLAPFWAGAVFRNALFLRHYFIFLFLFYFSCVFVFVTFLHLNSVLQNVGVVHQFLFARSMNSLFLHWFPFITTNEFAQNLVKSLGVQGHLLLQ